MCHLHLSSRPEHSLLLGLLASGLFPQPPATLWPRGLSESPLDHSVIPKYSDSQGGSFSWVFCKFWVWAHLQPAPMLPPWEPRWPTWWKVPFPFTLTVKCVCACVCLVILYCQLIFLEIFFDLTDFHSSSMFTGLWVCFSRKNAFALPSTAAPETAWHSLHFRLVQHAQSATQSSKPTWGTDLGFWFLFRRLSPPPRARAHQAFWPPSRLGGGSFPVPSPRHPTLWRFLT